MYSGRKQKCPLKQLIVLFLAAAIHSGPTNFLLYYQKRPLPEQDGAFYGLYLVRSYEFVATAMDIDNLNLRIIFEKLAQLGDIHIHASGVEVIVVDPYRLQGVVALQNLVDMLAKKR